MYRIPAALLLSGWLLMLPPTEGSPSKDYGIRSDLPVTQWHQESAHDVAKDCEELKVTIIQSLIKRFEATGDRSASASANVYAEARCIPADHIYPPKKPGG